MSLTSYQAAPPRVVNFTMSDRSSKRNKKKCARTEIEKILRLAHNGSMGAGKILIRTASWSDPGFVVFWYPKKMRPPDRRCSPAQHFTTVAVNSSCYPLFYLTPFRRWCYVTLQDF